MTTLAHGQTVQQKWGRLGGFTGPQILDPALMSAFVFGLPDSGKSAFLQSNPDAWINNFDGSSTTAADPVAVRWPGVDPSTSMMIGDDGRPMVLTYEKVMEKDKLLIELATSGQPRPKTIVDDSLSTLLPLVRDYVVRKSTSLGISKDPVENWRQLHGPAAYDAAYEIVVNRIQSLKNAGYGVWLIGHMALEKIPIGEDRFVQAFGFTFGDGLWKRLFPLFEFSACVVAEDTTEMTTTEEEIEMRPGVKVKKTRQVPNPVRKVRVVTKRHDIKGMTKSRTNFDQFELPRKGAWAAFAAAYRRASEPAPSGAVT